MDFIGLAIITTILVKAGAVLLIPLWLIGTPLLYIGLGKRGLPGGGDLLELGMGL